MLAVILTFSRYFRAIRHYREGGNLCFPSFRPQGEISKTNSVRCPYARAERGIFYHLISISKKIICI